MFAFDEDPIPLETGDGELAIAYVEAWLARKAAAEPLDWEGRLGEIRTAFDTLMSLSLLRGDPLAAAILVDMTFAEDMEEFALEVDRLSDRVAQLLSERKAERAAAAEHRSAALNLGATQRPVDATPRALFKL